MAGEKKVLALIPARGGSKGVRRKNVRRICGKPLIEYSIDAARESRLLSRIVVSTEDSEVASICIEAGCEVLERPASLAADDTPMIAVVKHVLRALESNEGYRPSLTVLLQPTSPLRRGFHIDEALDLQSCEKADSVIGVTAVPAHHHPGWQFEVGQGRALQLYGGRPISELPTRRQDLVATYCPNGAIYVFKTEVAVEQSTLYGDRCLGYLMSGEMSVDIDSDEDLYLAERQLKQVVSIP